MYTVYSQNNIHLYIICTHMDTHTHAQTPTQQTGKLDFNRMPERITCGGGFGPVWNLVRFYYRQIGARSCLNKLEERVFNFNITVKV